MKFENRRASHGDKNWLIKSVVNSRLKPEYSYVTENWAIKAFPRATENAIETVPNLKLNVVKRREMAMLCKNYREFSRQQKKY